MRLLIFGAGRVGLSTAAYARHLGVEATIVRRETAESDPAAVAGLIERADVVAAALPDAGIAAWRAKWKEALGARPAIHFSGALAIEGMRAYHPLYSFPKTPLDPERMGSVIIAREKGSPPFATVLPGATNPELELSAEERALYHAFAVISGNFAAHLWNETAKAMKGRFGLPPEDILRGYLSGIVDRFAESPLDSLTGPAARKDRESVEANLAALSDEPRLLSLYCAFLASAWPAFERERGEGR